MIEQISSLLGGYVPQLIGALLILIVGWFIAQLVSRIADRSRVAPCKGRVIVDEFAERLR